MPTPVFGGDFQLPVFQPVFGSHPANGTGQVDGLVMLDEGLDDLAGLWQ
ncbi:MAG TPA: hypothetical protein VFB55_13750 [Verrucomicrobiae bacterium]|nr:hypothetical protein [Verrucomicrobiae bacterium]